MKLLGYYEEKAQQTDAELCKDGLCIEPEYTRAQAIAERVMLQFEAEHFKPLVKKIEDLVSENLWSLLQSSLLSDTQHNIAGHIRDRVNVTIHALLCGEPWAVNLYVIGRGWDKEAIRRGIAEAIPVALQLDRIVDLESEVLELKNELQAARDWNRR